MKDFDAMMLAVVRDWRRTGVTPPRDLVLAFTADEEAGGDYGAHYLVDNHPELFDGCTEAVGEVGGFSVLGQRRPAALPDPDGREGHRLAALAREGPPRARLDAGTTTTRSPRWPRRSRASGATGSRSRSPRRYGTSSSEISDVLGIDLDPDDPELAIAKLGPIANLIGATIRDTANPTGLTAGYKHNVIPGTASATVDCRTLPGRSEAFLAELRDLVGPDIEIELRAAPPGRGDHVRRPARRRDGGGAAGRGLRAPGRCRTCCPAAPTPRRSRSSACAASASRRCGCRADLNFAALFHGIDERVPVEGLKFGVRVLDRFLAAAAERPIATDWSPQVDVFIGRWDGSRHD